MIQASLLRAVFAFAVCAWAGDVTAAAIQRVRVSAGPDVTRVVFELSAAVEHRVFALDNPDRIVIDLPASSVRSSVALPAPTGIVTGMRTGGRPNGELRVVLELAAAAKAKTFLLQPEGRNGHRLVVDISPAGEASGVWRAVESVVPAAGRDLVIAIDAGHGGQDPGATGKSGGLEKDVVLEIARRLEQEIAGEWGMSAVLVRDGDYYVSHRRRMEIAHRAQADFFISIHADAARDRDAKGSTVYILSEKGASDEAAQLLAQRENASDLLGGVSLADKDQVLARVLLDLSQNAALTASTAAGQHLLARLGKVTSLRRSQVQQAPFVVLKSPDIPSVLVETAYISNPREETQLRSAAYQSAMAKALKDGIVDYFRANPPPGSLIAMAEDAPRTAALGTPAAGTAAGTAAATVSAAASTRPSPVAAAVKRPAAPPAKARAVPTRHVIVRGETLSGIAQHYRVSTSSLRRSNRLDNDVIRVGQVLTIPRL